MPWGLALSYTNKMKRNRPLKNNCQNRLCQQALDSDVALVWKGYVALEYIKHLLASPQVKVQLFTYLQIRIDTLLNEFEK